MKRLVGVLLLAGTLLTPAFAFAEGGKPIGVYVGAKLGMSAERMFDRKISGSGWYEDAQNNGPDFGWGMGSKTDTVFSGGVTVGYDLAPRLDIPVRLELDYTLRGDAKASTRKNTSYEYLDSGSVVSGVSAAQRNTIGLQTLMVNTWVDIPTGTSFTPYLGGGVGMAFISHKTRITISDPLETDSLTGSKNSTNFAWSLGGGLAYDFTQNWTVDLGYRFIDAGKANITVRDIDGDPFAKSAVSVQAHDVLLGVRYTF